MKKEEFILERKKLILSYAKFHTFGLYAASIAFMLMVWFICNGSSKRTLAGIGIAFIFIVFLVINSGIQSIIINQQIQEAK